MTSDGMGRWLLGAVLAMALAGCGGATYRGVSAHTIQVGPDREADVVWVVRNDNRLMRCWATDQGPTCVTASQH
jgi:hypothetical protein